MPRWRSGRAFYLLLGLGFLVALTIRLLRIDLDVYGDEAWYYYLARDLATTDAHVTSVASSPLAHLVMRPVSAIFFWPWAQLGLTAVRLVNIVIGSLAVVQVGFLARRLECGPVIAAAAGWIVALHVSCWVSAVAFPDALATAFMLLGVHCYLSGRLTATFVVFALCLLTKEMFAPVPLALAILCVRRGKRWGLTMSPMGWALLASLLPILAATLVAIFALGARAQGWSPFPADLRFWLALLVPPLLVAWPVLYRTRRFTELALSAAFPVFFFLWTYARQGGVDLWYVAAAVPLSALGLAGFGTAASEWMRSRSSPWLRRLAVVLAVTAGLAAAVVSVRSALRWENRWVVDSLGEPRELEVVGALVANHAPRELYLVDCFWGYAFYPFATSGRHVTRLDDGAGPADLTGADLVVYCGQTEPIDPAMQPCRLLQTEHYAVYRSPSSCLAP